MKNIKTQNKILNFGIYIFMICFGFGISCFVFAKATFAQEVSLAISPPLTEIVIQPGRSYAHTITVKNNGIPVTLVPKIVPFVPFDKQGHAELIEDKVSVDAFNNWFIFDPSPVTITTTGIHNFTIRITPPVNAELKDYYFTFVAEVKQEDGIGVNSTQAQARIGANILLTASKDDNPHKNASIVEFSAPVFLDSFSPLNYKIILGNSGASFFKPIGKITIDQIFGSTISLNLAPLNILVGGEREISCIEGQELIPCTLPGKFSIGIYHANLSFTIDGNGQSIEKDIYTVAFPFTILLGLITIAITYGAIRRFNP